MKDFFAKLKLRVQSLLRGSHGPDQLSLALNYAALALLILGLFTRLAAFSTLGYAVFIWSIFRMLSKNNVRRGAENRWFLSKWQPVAKRVSQVKARLKNRKTTVYFRCPKCKALLKLPRGVGAVTVTCGQCANRFEKKA